MTVKNLLGGFSRRLKTPPGLWGCLASIEPPEAM